MSTNTNHRDTTSSEVGATERILQSVLATLNEGKIAEVADQFDDHFTFTDHALDLEFSDRGRLIEFFRNPVSCSRTPWWKQTLSPSVEIRLLFNGSLRQRRRYPMVDIPIVACQFPFEVYRSCI